MKKEDEITKEFLDNILESMEGGVFTIDKNARITSFNRAAEEITGFKRAEVLNKECCHILKSDLCQDICPLKETLETGKTFFGYEIMITSKTGKRVPVNIATSPLRSSNNEIIGAVENFRDLTKHKGL